MLCDRPGLISFAVIGRDINANILFTSYLSFSTRIDHIDAMVSSESCDRKRNKKEYAA